MKRKTNWTRRKLLGAIPRSFATVMLGVNAAQAGDHEKSRGVRFGVRSPFQERDLRQRALLLQRLGYQGIELGPEWLDRSAESILADLKGTGILVSAIVGSLKLLDPDPKVRAQTVELARKRLEMARILGAVGLIEVPAFGACKFPR